MTDADFEYFREKINTDDDRGAVFKEIFKSLSEADEFVLVYSNKNSNDPGIFGYGTPNETILQGLYAASSFLTEEIQKECEFQEIPQLSQFILEHTK